MKTFRLAVVLLCAATIAACSAGGNRNTGSLPSTPAGAQSLGRTPAAGTSRHLAMRRPMAAKLRLETTIADPGFESGAVGAWYHCGNLNALFSTARAHAGVYSQLDGRPYGPEVYGDSGLCQDVVVPPSGLLSFWVYQGTSETSTYYAFQEADFLDSAGYIVANFYMSAANTNGWVHKTYDASAFAGQSLTVYFGVHADGYPYGYMYQYVDDVMWANTATPAPSPTP